MGVKIARRAARSLRFRASKAVPAMTAPLLKTASREPAPPFDAALVLATARDLLRAGSAGGIPPLLVGRHLCLLGASRRSREADAFREGARELGAQVTALHPSQLALRTPADVVRCAGMLSRLYDAVECQGIASELVRQLGAAAEIPVYDGVGGDGHATALLAAELDRRAAPAERRRRVLQAVLANALS